MKNILLLLLLPVAGACNKSIPDQQHTRELFDAQGLHVITSFANTQQQTMSILYGNTTAEKCALSGYKTHFAGEIFQLVTYKQADNKFWYGSHINGAVKSVETVSSAVNSDAADQLTYKLERGDSFGDNVVPAARMSYIFSHKPAVFP